MLSEMPSCMHHLQGKLPFPPIQHILAIPSDCEKCSLALPISLFSNSTGPCGSKLLQPMNTSQFLGPPLSAHTIPLK